MLKLNGPLCLLLSLSKLSLGRVFKHLRVWEQVQRWDIVRSLVSQLVKVETFSLERWYCLLRHWYSLNVLWCVLEGELLSFRVPKSVLHCLMSSLRMQIRFSSNFGFLVVSFWRMAPWFFHCLRKNFYEKIVGLFFVFYTSYRIKFVFGCDWWVYWLFDRQGID